MKKRKTRPVDEIDQVFEKLGKKVKRAELNGGGEPAAKKAEKEEGQQETKSKKDGEKKKKRRKEEGEGEARDKGLDDVLGAIKAAPKDEKKHHHKRKV